MKIYIDNVDMNIVKIKAWGDSVRPSNTIVAESESKYDELFKIMDRVLQQGEPTYIYVHKGVRQFKKTAIFVNDPLYTEYEGQYLVYNKSNSEVLLNPVKPSIQLTTDATDVVKPFNNLPDIKADGKSSCIITVTKYNSLGVPLLRSKDRDVIQFSTTNGTLSVSSTNLVSGRCHVTLTSSVEVISKQVEIRASMGSIEGTIIIQFAPPSAYE